MSVEAGQTLSHYRVIEKIGEGGMGVVRKAEDTVLGRTVAIKVLPADVARDGKRREMFLQETRLASSVGAAHIAQVQEFGREDDLDFIVMEYVVGKPLSKFLHGRPRRLFGKEQIGGSVSEYDIHPDGKRFIMLRSERDRSTPMEIVVDWFAELERLVPATN